MDFIWWSGVPGEAVYVVDMYNGAVYWDDSKKCWSDEGVITNAALRVMAPSYRMWGLEELQKARPDIETCYLDLTRAGGVCDGFYFNINYDSVWGDRIYLVSSGSCRWCMADGTWSENSPVQEVVDAGACLRFIARLE